MPSLRQAVLGALAALAAPLAAPLARAEPPPVAMVNTSQLLGWDEAYHAPSPDTDFEWIARDYPELAPRAGKIRERYLASPLHLGAQALRLAEKQEHPGYDSEAVLRILEKDHPETMKGLSHTGSRASATAFLDASEATLHHTGTGYTLFQSDCLAHAPAYRQTPLLEYTDGWKVRFQHKAAPSDPARTGFTLDLPASWIQASSPPHAPGRSFTHAFISGAGRGPVTLYIGIKPTGPATPGERLPLLALAEAWHRRPTGSPAPDKAALTLAGQPATLVIYETPVRDTWSRTLYYHTLDTSPLQIDLAFTLTPPPVIPAPDKAATPVTPDPLHKSYAPLLTAIANSLTVP
ncbi:hypothetical protein [Luteolibacter sp. LG18]|uniref:hypothetical protein n=1 Tax=Luteolibacter sp. LG18 TaxID=2819286 RepID=UPI002B2B523C|nr:hypothetical protein llg_26920 [Luteolibacter sp. LG18]